MTHDGGSDGAGRGLDGDLPAVAPETVRTLAGAQGGAESRADATEAWADYFHLSAGCEYGHSIHDCECYRHPGDMEHFFANMVLDSPILAAIIAERDRARVMLRKACDVGMRRRTRINELAAERDRARDLAAGLWDEEEKAMAGAGAVMNLLGEVMAERDEAQDLAAALGAQLAERDHLLARLARLDRPQDATDEKWRARTPQDEGTT